MELLLLQYELWNYYWFSVDCGLSYGLSLRNEKSMGPSQD